MPSQFKLRRDTAANWTSVNPTLADGEPGFERDTGRLKIGNGSSTWSALTYASLGYTGSKGDVGYTGSASGPTGPWTYTGRQTFEGSNTDIGVFVKNAFEKINITNSAATGTINLNVTDESVVYYKQNSTANWTLNIRGNASVSLNSFMAVNNSVTVVFLAKNGSTPYYANNIQVDGTTVTPMWVGGNSISAGNANSVDAYTFTVIKTANATYDVLGTQVQWK